MPLQVGSVSYERQPIADHANGLAASIQGNLQRSLEAIGVVRVCSFAAKHQEQQLSVVEQV